MSIDLERLLAKARQVGEEQTTAQNQLDNLQARLAAVTQERDIYLAALLEVERALSAAPSPRPRLLPAARPELPPADVPDGELARDDNDVEDGAVDADDAPDERVSEAPTDGDARAVAREERADRDTDEHEMRVGVEAARDNDCDDAREDRASVAPALDSEGDDAVTLKLPPEGTRCWKVLAALHALDKPSRATDIAWAIGVTRQRASAYILTLYHRYPGTLERVAEGSYIVSAEVRARVPALELPASRSEATSKKKAPKKKARPKTQATAIQQTLDAAATFSEGNFSVSDLARVTGWSRKTAGVRLATTCRRWPSVLTREDRGVYRYRGQERHVNDDANRAVAPPRTEPEEPASEVHLPGESTIRAEVLRLLCIHGELTADSLADLLDKDTHTARQALFDVGKRFGHLVDKPCPGRWVPALGTRAILENAWGPLPAAPPKDLGAEAEEEGPPPEEKWRRTLDGPRGVPLVAVYLPQEELWALEIAGQLQAARYATVQEVDADRMRMAMAWLRGELSGEEAA